jgi:hypothetical protein
VLIIVLISFFDKSMIFLFIYFVFISLKAIVESARSIPYGGIYLQEIMYSLPTIYSRIIPELFQDYSRIIPALFQNYSRIIPGLFRDYSRIIPELFQNIDTVSMRLAPCAPALRSCPALPPCTPRPALPRSASI